MTIPEIQTATTNLFNEVDRQITAEPNSPWLVLARGRLSDASGAIASHINSASDAAAPAPIKPVATPLQRPQTAAAAGNGRPSA
jgi:hypothetical protein